MSARVSTGSSSEEQEWAEQWLESVASGSSTMSQRKLSSIEKRAGGIDLVKQVARKLRVHLVQLTDDKGNVLVAASKHEFKVIT